MEFVVLMIGERVSDIVMREFQDGNSLRLEVKKLLIDKRIRWQTDGRHNNAQFYSRRNCFENDFTNCDVLTKYSPDNFWRTEDTWTFENWHFLGGYSVDPMVDAKMYPSAMSTVVNLKIK